MSRSGYSEDCEGWDLIRWRGAVSAALKGERGQVFLKELLAALDAMPAKRLIADELVQRDGEVCAIGALGLARGTRMDDLDPEDYFAIARRFGVARALVCELEYENDKPFRAETPEHRWQRVRDWVERLIRG